MRLPIVLAVVLALVGAGCGESPPAVKDGPWIVQQLKHIADQGAVFDPAVVQKMLDMTLRPSTRETMPQPPVCSRPAYQRSNLLTTYETEVAWFKPTAAGLQQMKIPSAFNFPATTAGAPEVSYTVNVSTGCAAGALPVKYGTLALKSLSGFTCFSQDDIKHLLDARDENVSEGFHYLAYEGLTNAEVRTTLVFVFTIGAPYALSAVIDQRANPYQSSVSKRLPSVEELLSEP